MTAAKWTPGLRAVRCGERLWAIEWPDLQSATVPTKEDALLLAAAPDMAEALELGGALLVKAQRLCGRSILPASDASAVSAERFQQLMVELLDGPEQREAQGTARAALGPLTEEPDHA